MWVALRSQEQPLIDSQQGNEDLSPTASKNEILPLAQEPEEGLSTRCRAAADTWVLAL